MLPNKRNSAEAPSTAGSNPLPLRPPLLQQHTKQYNSLCILLLIQETCGSIDYQCPKAKVIYTATFEVYFELTFNNLMSTLNKEFIPASLSPELVSKICEFVLFPSASPFSLPIFCL